jgi:Protein of unknown function (DUF3575)
MKKKITLLASVCLMSLSSIAGVNTNDECSLEDSVAQANTLILEDGEASSFHHVKIIKLNATQLINKNISMQFEYAFHKNMSAALGGSLLLPRTLPEQFKVEPQAGITQTDPTISGWSITPEFRFYPGKKIKHQAPHGFYLAPYMRYSTYSINTTMTEDSSAISLDLTMKYHGTSYGLMIGSQWLIGNHFAIDWWILGAGYGMADLDVDAKAKGVALTQQEQNDYSDDIISTLQDATAQLGVGRLAPTTTTSNSISTGLLDLPMISIRGFGFTLGFRF